MVITFGWFTFYLVVGHYSLLTFLCGSGSFGWAAVAAGFELLLVGLVHLLLVTGAVPLVVILALVFFAPLDSWADVWSSSFSFTTFLYFLCKLLCPLSCLCR